MKFNKRNINGVLLLDKPKGVGSNEVLQIVKRLFKASKAGHTGSLDPIATGMLPICFGEATKFSQFLLEANKHYVVTGKLGEVTDSQDSESVVTKKTEVLNIDTLAIEKILPKFRGEIMQVPPMYSAIKHKGQPLYKLARQGISIERQGRLVNIYEIKLLDLIDNLVRFDIKCSKGTYIRTVVADIGEALGCGAHVVELRRLGVGSYSSEQMVSLKQIEELATSGDYQSLDSLLLPIETMLLNMPEIFLPQDMIFYMHQGQSLLVPKVPESGLVRINDKSGRFVGVGEVMPDGKVAPRKMYKIN